MNVVSLKILHYCKYCYYDDDDPDVMKWAE